MELMPGVSSSRTSFYLFNTTFPKLYFSGQLPALLTLLIFASSSPFFNFPAHTSSLR